MAPQRAHSALRGRGMAESLWSRSHSGQARSSARFIFSACYFLRSGIVPLVAALRPRRRSGEGARRCARRAALGGFGGGRPAAGFVVADRRAGAALRLHADARTWPLRRRGFGLLDLGWFDAT